MNTRKFQTQIHEFPTFIPGLLSPNSKDPLQQIVIYVFTIAFYHKLFQHPKSTLFLQLSLGNSLRNPKSYVWKTIFLATLFPVCVLVILPYESSSQNPNICQTFRTFKIQTLAQIHYFQTFSIFLTIFFYFDCITQILFIGPKSQILEPYISIYTFTFIECLSFILHSLHSNY